MGKRFLHRRRVIENIGVVELHIVYDANFRKVVDELTSLIKKSRVIFIPLENDPLAIGKPGTTGKITRKTSDENDGFRPAKSNIQAIGEVVVDLPCVSSQQWSDDRV